MAYHKTGEEKLMFMVYLYLRQCSNEVRYLLRTSITERGLWDNFDIIRVINFYSREKYLYIPIQNCSLKRVILIVPTETDLSL